MYRPRRDRRIYIYTSPHIPYLKVTELVNYLKYKFTGWTIISKPDFFVYWLTRNYHNDKIKTDEITRNLVQSKVTDATRPITIPETMLPAEIDYETRILTGKITSSGGILYDGFRVQEIGRELISASVIKLNYIHIILTSRLLATYDTEDKRYHLRTGIYGIPSLISIPGLVLAPAKPRAFYWLKQQFSLPDGTKNKVITDWEKENQSKFISVGDARTTEVVKGFLLQSIFYHLTGNPFCMHINCRLYNAHLQSELVRSQLGKRQHELCKLHTQLLKNFITTETRKFPLNQQ